MTVARSSGAIRAARARAAPGSRASASRPRARSSSSVVAPGAGSKAITCASRGSSARTSASFAACAGEMGQACVPGPYCEKPVKLTGAGDRFNAGFGLGLLLQLPAEQRLRLLVGHAEVMPAGGGVGEAGRCRLMIAAPLFHSWGFFHFVISLPTSSTIVLRRRFDEEETLRGVQDHRAEVLAVVPVMLQRILQLPEETLAAYDLSALRITSLSGSALPGELATAWMDRFGDNVYNLYGSTEVAYATVATPEDLRAAPGTAGRAPRGTVVRLYDEAGREAPQGEVGRIFVGNEMSFEGYTGGGGKEVIDDLLCSGDVGHFDADGRLFIDGRDDEMIVSGGENVFPREVEDLLADHEAVVEVAVIGVEDEEYGQRLKAFVVASAEADVSEDELKSHVKANLAGYKAPREVEFLEELPRNATGKILKRELHAREAQKQA